MRLLFSLMLLFHQATVWASAPIKVFFDNGSVPFMSGNGSDAKGIYPAITSAIVNKANLKSEFIGVPWKRALQSAEQGEGWVGGIVKTEERLKTYVFTDAIFSEDVVAFTLKGGKKIKSMADLAGLRVGSNRGWSHGTEWDKLKSEGKITILESENATTNLQRLLDGGIDVYITVREDGLYAAKSLKDGNKIVTEGSILAKNTTHLAIGKASAKKEVLATLNSAINALTKSGELAKTGQAFLKAQ